MHFPPRNMRLLREHLGLTLLICFHIVICCISTAYVTQRFDTYHLSYDPNRLPAAIVIVATFALVSLLLVFSNFSFGYFVGFYLYTMVLGYLWLSWFSGLNYDHRLAELSAVVSTVAFLLP